MKIEGNITNEFSVGDLEIGDCFIFYNTLYMRITEEHIDMSYCNRKNDFLPILNLEKNRVILVYQDEQVTKVNAKIVIG